MAEAFVIAEQSCRVTVGLRLSSGAGLEDQHQCCESNAPEISDPVRKSFRGDLDISVPILRRTYVGYSHVGRSVGQSAAKPSVFFSAKSEHRTHCDTPGIKSHDDFQRREWRQLQDGPDSRINR